MAGARSASPGTRTTLRHWSELRHGVVMEAVFLLLEPAAWCGRKAKEHVSGRRSEVIRAI